MKTRIRNTITRTTLNNLVLLRKVNAAMWKAVRLNKEWACGYGTAYVLNRNGEACLRVTYRPGQGFTFWAPHCFDVTPAVVYSLRRHADSVLEYVHG